jgi:hypothetical protein
MIRDLHHFHGLLLADVPADPEEGGSWLDPCVDPASPTVEAICIVMDALEGLLVSIGDTVSCPLFDGLDDEAHAICF